MREIIFILFVFSGLFKSLLIYHNITLPIDFTLITALLVILTFITDAASSGIMLFSPKRLVPTILLLAFFFWMSFSLIYSPSPVYKYQKTGFFILNIIAFIRPIWGKYFQAKRFVRYFIYLSLLFSIWYLYVSIVGAKLDRTSAQFSIYASFYLVSSFIDGISILILLTSKKDIFEKQIKWGLIILLFFMMILTRGRGPLFFLILLVMVYVIYRMLKHPSIRYRFSRKSIINAVLYVSQAVFLGGLFIIYYSEVIFQLFSTTMKRMGLLFGFSSSTIAVVNSSKYGESVDTRLAQIYQAIHMIFSDVFHFFWGYGIGSFGLLTRGIDGRYYPHNVFLEILVELGLVGFILFFSYLLVTLHSGKTKYISLFTMVFLFLNAMKSSSIIDLRMSFAIFALYLLAGNLQSSHAKN